MLRPIGFELPRLLSEGYSRKYCLTCQAFGMVLLSFMCEGAQDFLGPYAEASPCDRSGDAPGFMEIALNGGRDGPYNPWYLSGYHYVIGEGGCERPDR